MGEALARKLSADGNDVVVIEKDPALAEGLAGRLDALVLNGDAAAAGILKDADAGSCDSVLAVTGDDRANLMACEAAREAGAKITVARVGDPSNEEAFARAGVPFIGTTSAAVRDFLRALADPGPVSWPAAGGKAEIAEFAVRRGSRISGLAAGKLPGGVSVALMLRDGKLLMPAASMEIREGDVLTVCFPAGGRKRLEKLMRAR